MMSGDDPGRMEQVLKVDANALLKTIRDLEYKLSEYQRQDKPPGWAISLDTRLQQVEKLLASQQTSTPISSPPKSQIRASNPMMEPIRDNSVDPQPLTIQGLTLEDRILTKMRNELDVKIANSQVHFDNVISASNLEMERIHKLLNIRPTTSEMQQIMVAVNNVETKTMFKLSEMQNLMFSQLKDRVSQEMLVLFDELKNNRSQSEEINKLYSKQFGDYGLQLTELRQGVDNSLQLFSTQMNELQDVMKQKTRSLQNQLDETNEALRKQDLKQTKHIEEFKADYDYQINKFDEQNQTFHEQINEIQQQSQVFQEKINEQLAHFLVEFEEIKNTTNENQLQIEDNKLQIKDNYSLFSQAIDEQKLSHESLTRKVDRTISIVDEFYQLDFPGRLKKHDEHLNKINYDIIDLQNQLKALEQNELQPFQQKVTTLIDLCNVRIPAVLNEQGIRIDNLTKESHGHLQELERHQHQIKLLNIQNETILLPLQQEYSDFKSGEYKHLFDEVAAIKELVTASIDNHAEFVHRLEELEETFEGFDANIVERINHLRDNLMEMLIEKQSETSQNVRHLKDNLDVMSMAGDSHTKLGRMNSNVGARFDVGDKEGPPTLRGAVSNLPDHLKRGGSFRRPTIAGTFVQGNSVMASDQSPMSQAPLMSQASSRGMPMTQAPMVSQASSRGMPMTRDPSARRMDAPAPMMASKNPSSRLPSIPSYDHNAYPNLSVDSHSVTPQSRQYIPEEDEDHDDAPENHHYPAVADDQGSVGFGDQSVTSGSSQVIAQPVNPIIAQIQAQVQAQMPIIQQHPNSHSMHSNAAPVAYDTQGGMDQLTEIPNRNDLLTSEYSSLLDASTNYPHFPSAQYLSDLCVNYESISMKKKRVTNIPSALCRQIADVANQIAEFIAASSDFEMVEKSLIMVSNNQGAQEISYDENFVFNARQAKVEEFLNVTTSIISSASGVQQPGMVRLDARSLFLSLIKKAVEMFLTKYNQVLVVGNSRLGRVKIPTCIACDRPLLEKTKLDSVVQSPPGGRSGIGGGPFPGSLLSYLDGDGDDPASQTYGSIDNNNSRSRANSRPRTSNQLMNSSSLTSLPKRNKQSRPSTSQTTTLPNV